MTFAMGTPLLDGCVLAILDQEDTYGYALTQRVKGGAGHLGVHAVSGASAAAKGRVPDGV